MRNTSMLKNNLFFLIFFFCFFGSKPCLSDEAKRIIVDAYKYPAQVKYLGKIMMLDKTLNKEWKQINKGFAVTDVPFLIDSSKLLWLVIKLPSKPNSLGRGLCGAGTEDYFYLVRLQGKTLSYVDKFLGRGCLAFTEIGYGADLDERLEGITVNHATLMFEQHKTDIETEKKTLTKVSLIPSKNNIQAQIVEIPVSEKLSR